VKVFDQRSAAFSESGGGGTRICLELRCLVRSRTITLWSSVIGRRKDVETGRKY
jgi:hypothetical protein